MNITNEGSTLKLSWDPVSDNGSSYTYQIRAVAQNGSMTPLSNPQTINVVSGIKGYSIVIDQNPDTIPNGTITTTQTSYSQTVTAGEKYYIHIASVDNSGNVSDVKHYSYEFPALVATAMPQDNSVFLNWWINDSKQSYNYMIYKKDENATEFQTIPAKNTVKVLNIYPPVDEKITFTNWKGETFTLPKSASAKMWLEMPNAEDPKGYGKGLISVDTVSITDFNRNPSYYLKDSNGNYKYDVIYEGAWDANNGNQYDTDYTLQAVQEIIDFIKSGGGYLCGHDTIMNPNEAKWAKNASMLKDYLNIKLRNMDGMPSFNNLGNTKIQIVKKGLLTNYPWKIGDVGDMLNVPLSHTTGQYALGDVWLKYVSPFNSYPGPEVNLPNGGTNNFYLVTWNNTAMIQTGHSDGSATADEQKILANALFYLAQITNNNKWLDHSAQDITPPEKVSNINISTDEQKVSISFQEPIDKGNTYQYYVHAIGETGNTANSPIVSATITTGIKGYSYVIDKNPDTIPDNIIDTVLTTITKEFEEGGTYYLHIKAIDNAENASEVTTVPFVVEDPLQVSALEIIDLVNPPLGTTLPVYYPVTNPVHIKAGYKITMAVRHKGADRIDFKLYADGKPLYVHTDSGDTTVISKTTTRNENVTYFVFGWIKKCLKERY